MREHRLRIAGFVDSAFVHEDQPIADFARETHFVRHHDQRHPLAGEPAHDAQHFVDQFRVERRGDLVAQQHLGRHRQRTGDGDALLLAARKLIGKGVELLGEADAAEHRAGDRLGLDASRLLDHLRRQHDVLPGRKVREQVELLKHHAHFLAQRAQIAVVDIESGAVDLDGAVVDALKSVQRAQQGAFAGTAAADDGHHLALFDVQMDAAQDVVLAVKFMQSVGANERHGISFPGIGHNGRADNRA